MSCSNGKSTKTCNMHGSTGVPSNPAAEKKAVEILFRSVQQQADKIFKQVNRRSLIPFCKTAMASAQLDPPDDEKLREMAAKSVLALNMLSNR